MSSDTEDSEAKSSIKVKESRRIRKTIHGPTEPLKGEIRTRKDQQGPWNGPKGVIKHPRT